MFDFTDCWNNLEEIKIHNCLRIQMQIQKNSRMSWRSDFSRLTLKLGTHVHSGITIKKNQREFKYLNFWETQLRSIEQVSFVVLKNKETQFWYQGLNQWPWFACVLFCQPLRHVIQVNQQRFMLHKILQLCYKCYLFLYFQLLDVKFYLHQRRTKFNIVAAVCSLII